MGQALEINAQIPEAFAGLFRPARYKVYYGGRGGAKSWNIARALLLLGMQKPLRILCARELQKSIADSVHKLLKDQIGLLGLEQFYEVLQHQIRGANGTEFNFEGIRHNVTQIKSYEGVDICWVEEAGLVSKESWEVLIPTIRKEGSEIWLSFNPELEEDETYKRFVKNPPKDSIVVKVNWRDNPFFPQTLYNEMIELKEKDEEAWMNVWEGFPRRTISGAIYAKELAKADLEGRICRVHYDRIKPVDVFVDLGRADMCSFWFGQQVALEYRWLKAYENSGQEWAFYLKMLQNTSFIIGTVWLPHDAAAKVIGTRKSVEEQTRDAGFKCRIVPRLSVSDGINAARTLFPNSYFDAAGCESGIFALRRYQYEVKDGQRKPQPLHNQYSHFADAFRYAAIAIKEPKPHEDIVEKAKKKARAMARLPGVQSVTGWMR